MQKTAFFFSQFCQTVLLNRNYSKAEKMKLKNFNEKRNCTGTSLLYLPVHTHTHTHTHIPHTATFLQDQCLGMPPVTMNYIKSQGICHLCSYHNHAESRQSIEMGEDNQMLINNKVSVKSCNARAFKCRPKNSPIEGFSNIVTSLNTMHECLNSFN